MRTAASYDYKLHSDPKYVKAYRERLEKEKQQRSDAELLKPKTWGI